MHQSRQHILIRKSQDITRKNSRRNQAIFGVMVAGPLGGLMGPMLSFHAPRLARLPDTRFKLGSRDEKRNSVMLQSLSRVLA